MIRGVRLPRGEDEIAIDYVLDVDPAQWLPRLVGIDAVVNAVGIIVVHNHPSGDPTPSGADVALTADLVRAGKLLDIDVIDHLIIGQGKWVSLRRLGLGFDGAG